MSTLVRISDKQMRDILKQEGCDCSDNQWSRRGDHCTTQWIRCRGRMAWKRRNDEAYQRGLARLGHQHRKGQRKSTPCKECDTFLEQLRRENAKSA